MIYLGADHRGFALKERIKAFLAERGNKAEDLGASAFDPSDDYVDFAAAVAEKVAEAPDARKGILLCGSGQGMAITANKFKGVHAALCWNETITKQSREHGNTNILVLPADELDVDLALRLVVVWLDTLFPNEERHARRLEKIQNLEAKLHG